MNIIQSQKGSVALISILIISATLILIVLGMSETQISNSYNYLNTTSDQIIYNLAESCFEDSIKRVEEDPLFTGSTTTFSDTDSTCISSISGTGTVTIEVELTYQNYTQHFEGQISLATEGEANNAELLNWGEIE